MRFRMVAEDVTSTGNFSNDLRTFASERPDKEECGARVVAIEQIEQLRRNRGVGPIVEGDCELAGRICSVDGWAK